MSVTFFSSDYDFKSHFKGFSPAVDNTIKHVGLPRRYALIMHKTGFSPRLRLFNGIFSLPMSTLSVGVGIACSSLSFCLFVCLFVRSITPNERSQSVQPWYRE